MISKSDYMLYLRHPAWPWLKKHEPKKLPPIDAATQARFDAGHAFEPYAESLFPGGYTLGFSDYDEYRSLPQRTHDAIAAGEKVLFQPRFEWQGFTCICDIVDFVGETEVDLYEIKSSTGARLEHEYDLAFQMAVLEGNGLRVRNVNVIHVNNQYVRHGAIEADKLTATTEVTDKVRARAAETATAMPQTLEVAKQPTMPDPDPSLARLNSKQEWMKVYEAIVPQHQKVWSKDTAPIINRKPIKQFLSGLKFPLYFLDYETLMSLIPYFDGQRPYQQVPFQYSLHIIRETGSALEHREYLHRANSDPARSLAKQLIADIGKSGSVIVWYEGFEKARNTELGEMFPEYADAMKAINDRVVDLMVPFKQKLYDDPRFDGSASIKNVLPVLVPELSYKSLGIQEGGTAQRLWMEAVLDGKHEADKDQILSDLSEYCKLDTLAMVEIYKKLQKL